jgi:hypothetical protein
VGCHVRGGGRLTHLRWLAQLSFYEGHGYLEMDVDIGSSATAHKALQLVMGYSANLVIDFAWVIEVRTSKHATHAKPVLLYTASFRAAQLNFRVGSWWWI